MIMQPVNVLPTFVSQDADLKTKDSSSSSEDRYKNNEFSSLVDKHVDDDVTAIAPKEPKTSIEATAANSGKAIAANGKNDTEAEKGRQETDSQKNTTVDKSNNNDQKAVELLAKENEVKQSKKEDKVELADNNALNESEQFISLLYSSDQTLTKTDEKTKPSDQVKQAENVDNKKGNSAKNSKKDILDVMVSQKNNAVSSETNDSVIESNSSVLLSQHKLKAFSKDELLARAQLKSSNVLVQKPSDQVLKDYQQLLQSQQGTGPLNRQSITSEQLSSSQLAKEQLVNAPLANMQLKSNKTPELAVTIPTENKVPLNEQVDTRLNQLSAESINKEKQAPNDLTTPPNEPVVKVSKKDSEKVAELSSKYITDLSAEMATEASEDSIEPASEYSNRRATELINNKATNGEVKIDKVNSPLTQINLDKINVERAAQSTVINEAVTKELPVDAQTKQPVMTSAQTQVLQHQQQAQQKEKAVNSESNLVEDVIDEYDYADTVNLSEQKTKGEGVTTTSKVIDSFTTRSVSEIQSQAIQANQIKQNSDAYMEHQASEVLNHSVASDTAQIQKNNVQLQQETISIFKKDFAEAVKDKVMVTINQKLQQFDITLDPPEFGNMQVRVNLQGEQAAVNFIVQNQQAKDALEQNMHKLKEMLSEQGVDVGGANVEQQDQQQSNEESDLAQGKNSSSQLTNNEDAHNVEHVLSAKLFDSSATGVDYYA